MTPRQSWREYRNVGLQYEQSFCRFLDHYNFKPRLVDGYHKEWDIKSETYQTTFEVKFDGVSKKTNRWAIEVEFQKPSGLSTTQATFWVLTDGQDWFYVSTDTLRQVCDKIAPCTITGKGDAKPKTVKFVSDEMMRQVSKTLTNAIKPFVI